MPKILIRLAQLIGLLLVVSIAILFLVSPQKTAPFLGDGGKRLNSSIAEIRTVMLNGVEQRILIRGKDINNPLLLHVHGGPGGPDQATIRSSGKTIEDLFTVVYWDQRGAGGSYSKDISADSLSLKAIVEDGILLSKKIKAEFNKEKIFLQGHSWGTLVGVHMVAKEPSLYYAYFGIGQIANSKQAESLSFAYTRTAAQKMGDKKTLKALAEIGAPPYQDDQTWIDTVMIERGLMQPYEIPGQDPLFSLTDVYKTFIFYPEYSIRDKLNSLAGSKMSLQALWMEAINANLFLSHPVLEVPVYIFQGKYDMHTVTEVAKQYFDILQAPSKEYIHFEDSAHWPHIKEHTVYREKLEEIIRKR